MLEQLEPYLPVFEGYLSSDNKEDYFNSLTDPTSKELLDILASPLYSISELK
jgi:hypothetical protein